MSPLPRSRHRIVAACAFAILASTSLFADPRVVVVAKARPEYTDRKYGEGKARRESYVVMQGRFYAGAMDDASLERMPFRQIIGYLFPQLAEQNFVPAPTVSEADLMLVVHWGATNPRVSTRELMSRTELSTPTPAVVPDAEAGDSERETVDALNNLLGAEDRYENLERIEDIVTTEGSDRDLAQLLGYSESLRSLGRRPITSTEEQTLRFDLRMERYFIIVHAYELKPTTSTDRRRPVWTLHMNMSSPGNNFTGAVAQMSQVAPVYFGRTTDGPETTRSRARGTKVELGELIILGEVSDGAARPAER